MEDRARFRIESVREFESGKTHLELRPVGDDEMPFTEVPHNEDLEPLREQIEDERKFNRMVSDVYETGLDFGRGSIIVSTDEDGFEPGQEVKVSIRVVEPINPPDDLKREIEHLNEEAVAR